MLLVHIHMADKWQWQDLNPGWPQNSHSELLVYATSPLSKFFQLCIHY